MSITKELASQFKDSPAIVCCRTTAGTVISPQDLEDPSIFQDMEESGLITITPDTLTIGQVLGARLTRDVEGLTSLTAELLEGVKTIRPPKTEEKQKHVSISKEINDGVLHIQADQIIGLNLSLPLNAIGRGSYLNLDDTARTGEPEEDQVMGTLIKRSYKVREVKLGNQTSFENGVLTIRKGLSKDALKANPLVKKIEIDIINPDNRHVYSNTIMDVIPVATKAEGELGDGVTHSLDDVVFVLTGVDEAGVQVHEFGSCEGYLDEKIAYGRPGCPDPNDIMVRVHVTIQALTGMERRGPYAAHTACDVIIQEIREVLKKKPASEAAKEEVMEQIRRHGRPRVLLVKEIMGQGAMHDNVMLPREPAGVPGGRQNVDLGNVPVVFSVNEVRDGGIHALTCIGPASKEDTRHYFREPVLEALAADPELDLVGVVFVGSPQVNDEKAFVARRLGAIAGSMDIVGAIVTTEGFGNNHIDFSYNIEEIGKRDVKVVGMTYAAYQGQLVVGNKYMDAMIEVNKDKGGFESEILGENTITTEDARRAVLMLKNKIAGVPIAPADHKWSQEVVDANQKIADSVGW